MAALQNTGAVTALRPSARHAAMIEKRPGAGGTEASNDFQQSSQREPRGHYFERPTMAGQQAAVDGPTLTSLELVEFINGQRTADDAELRHDHFMAKVPKVLGEGAPKFRDTYVHRQNGQRYHCYRFPKREACLMAMSYSYELQAKVFDRMTELERNAAAPALPNFADPVAAARAWADQVEQRERLAVENQRQAQALAVVAPKAGALDRIATATEGAVCLREAAKLAQVPERQFIEFLYAEGWIFKQRRGGRWMGRADKEAAGLLELKRSTFKRPNGTEGLDVQVLVTPRGVARLGELIERKAPHLRKTKSTSDDATQQLALLIANDDNPVPGGAT